VNDLVKFLLVVAGLLAAQAVIYGCRGILLEMRRRRVGSRMFYYGFFGIETVLAYGTFRYCFESW
jgi:hypothetical protein